MANSQEHNQYVVLTDLQGMPYKFYRGGQLNFSRGCFFCSCFDIAQGFRFPSTQPIIETEIAVKKPLVIDATMPDGYCGCDRICIRDCTIYPEEKRKSLIQYLPIKGAKNTLSTDEILEWARETDDIDAVIIKNVREGIESDFPIYDVAVWDASNLENPKDITNDDRNFDAFRQNTYKRVNLSAYIPEKEQDGVSSITPRSGYYISHQMQQRGKRWGLDDVLTVHTTEPIDIFELDTQCYVTAELKAPGVYRYTCGMTPRKKLLPHNGIIQIAGVPKVYKYKIIK